MHVAPFPFPFPFPFSSLSSPISGDSSADRRGGGGAGGGGGGSAVVLRAGIRSPPTRNSRNSRKSAITARFFRSMENIVKHARKIVNIVPCTNTKVVKYEKVWNYTIADITLLAFGTSFPQISLATIDAIRNLGNLTAGGLGPGTLVGSAAFDLFPIHAVCVVVPKAGTLKKISDLGVDAQGGHPLGGLANCFAIWLASTSCICSR